MSTLIDKLGAIVIVSLSAQLTGCATMEKVLPARTAVPTECREETPARPVMDTEQLQPGASLDAKTAAALAEIDRREGYEEQLRTALANCKRPITKGTP